MGKMENSGKENRALWGSEIKGTYCARPLYHGGSEAQLLLSSVMTFSNLFEYGGRPKSTTMFHLRFFLSFGRKNTHTWLVVLSNLSVKVLADKLSFYDISKYVNENHFHVINCCQYNLVD